MPSQCSIWSIPTKTPGVLSQFLGRSRSSLSNFSHVLSTIHCLVAFLPYFWLVEDLSRESRAFIMASHRLCISVSFGHSSSGFLLCILSHRSFQIRWALSDIRILYARFSPWRGFPLSLNSIRPHPVIAPMLARSGQVLCFFSHNSLVLRQTVFCPGISHCRRMCSRLSCPALWAVCSVAVVVYFLPVFPYFVGILYRFPYKGAEDFVKIMVSCRFPYLTVIGERSCLFFHSMSCYCEHSGSASSAFRVLKFADPFICE